MENYKRTKGACFLAYIISALINNFLPLLFLTLNREFGLSFDALGILISVNFVVQAIVDFFGAQYVERLGYRFSILLALTFSSLGFIALGTLPYLLSDTFIALFITVCLYAVGSGLIEVLISPIVAALPEDEGSKTMTILHSFYSWGHLLIVLVSTAFFMVFGLSKWRYLALFWALLPLIDILVFWKAPLRTFGEKVERIPVRNLFKNKLFLLLLLLMLCGGAAELTVSQWISVFAESSLGLEKSVGDILGPCLFALAMGISRVAYGKIRLSLMNALLLCGVLCTLSYFITVFSSLPLLSLLGCALTGLSVGIFWPGILSLAAQKMPGGGTAMLGFLALGGDIGCSLGPGLLGMLFDKTGSLSPGLLLSSLYPLIITLGTVYLIKKLGKNEKI